ncbi:MAG: hypothetical protein KC502_15905 [Myxococcales bacterium]|nr:hypothetical protein [Myxococcales bacterium]
MQSLRHQLTGFLVVSGGAVALQTAAKRMSGDMQSGLQSGAKGLFVVGCTLIGLWMLKTGAAELKRSAVANDGPPLPKHLRPSRSQALVSLLFGAVLGLGVPALMFFS